MITMSVVLGSPDLCEQCAVSLRCSVTSARTGNLRSTLVLIRACAGARCRAAGRSACTNRAARAD